MIAIVQRVRSASVAVESKIVGEIGNGLCALVAIEKDDGDEQANWLAEKLVHLRIFRGEDSTKHFDRDVIQLGGSILLVSNFTVSASTKKGRRPTLEAAADPVTGRVMFEKLVDAVKAKNVPVATGVFQADMLVKIENDGPATFIISTNE